MRTASLALAASIASACTPIALNGPLFQPAIDPPAPVGAESLSTAQMAPGPRVAEFDRSTIAPGMRACSKVLITAPTAATPRQYERELSLLSEGLLRNRLTPVVSEGVASAPGGVDCVLELTELGERGSAGRSWCGENPLLMPECSPQAAAQASYKLLYLAPTIRLEARVVDLKGQVLAVLALEQSAVNNLPFKDWGLTFSPGASPSPGSDDYQGRVHCERFEELDNDFKPNCAAAKTRTYAEIIDRVAYHLAGH